MTLCIDHQRPPQRHTPHGEGHHGVVEEAMHKTIARVRDDRAKQRENNPL